MRAGAGAPTFRRRPLVLPEHAACAPPAFLLHSGGTAAAPGHFRLTAELPSVHSDEACQRCGASASARRQRSMPLPHGALHGGLAAPLPLPRAGSAGQKRAREVPQLEEEQARRLAPCGDAEAAWTLALPPAPRPQQAAAKEQQHAEQRRKLAELAARVQALRSSLASGSLLLGPALAVPGPAAAAPARALSAQELERALPAELRDGSRRTDLLMLLLLS